mgnify:CR=1 FL=1
MAHKPTTPKSEQLTRPTDLPKDEEEAADPTRICWTQLLRDEPDFGRFVLARALLLREKRDAAVEELRRKYAPKLATLEDRVRRGLERRAPAAQALPQCPLPMQHAPHHDQDRHR